jgi:hypothetical protein
METETISNDFYLIILSLHAPFSQKGSIYCADSCCKAPSGPWYQCTTCFSAKVYCGRCIRKRHQDHPFHRIACWDVDGKCFIPIQWTALQMAWTFVHEDGSDCTSHGTIRNLSVLHVNGMHEIPYHSCSCILNDRKTQSGIRPTQLLANRLFPATFTAPTTAFTFEVLETLDALNLVGFINIKQFCDALSSLNPRSTRNTFDVSTKTKHASCFVFNTNSTP